MSYYDYKIGQEIAMQGYSFYALIQAAMRRADTDNALKLRAEWPEVWDELRERYNAPNGKLPGDDTIPHRLLLDDMPEDREQHYNEKAEQMP